MLERNEEILVRGRSTVREGKPWGCRAIREDAYNWPAFSKTSTKRRVNSNFCSGDMSHSDVHLSMDSGVI